MIILNTRRPFSQAFVLAGLILFLILGGLSACSAAADTELEEDNSGMDHDEDMSGMDHETRRFVPNDGAKVSIVSPADETVFKSSDSVPIVIETVDFTIGEDGKHWHIYLDDAPIMVMGGTSFVLQNLSPGAHQIEVFLSLGTHEDLEQGDKISIVVEE